jgi:hypothetical protein
MAQNFILNASWFFNTFFIADYHVVTFERTGPAGNKVCPVKRLIHRKLISGGGK